jgi:Outer membrane protein beta-barrel domain
MRPLARVTLALAAIVVLNALPAQAQGGYLAPALGITFGNPSGQGRADFVADLGWLSPVDPLGVELDFMYAPSFFGNQGPFGQNRVVTVMGNVMVAGGGSGRGRFGFGRHQTAVRPYVSGGLGLLREVATDPQGREFSNNDLGANVGVGVMASSRRSIGVRADLRYFRNLVGDQTRDNNVDFGSFHFWRAGIGIVIGF